MLEDNIDIVVSAVQKEKSECSMDSRFSLTCRNYPDLGLDLLMIQVGECCSSEL